MPTLISPEYSSLTTEALQATRALSEQKMLTLISNAAWLEEGFSAAPYNWLNTSMGNRNCFNHTGSGSGAYLRAAHTYPRGIVRDPDNPDEALLIDNSDDFKPVESLQWSFEAASDFTPKAGGANWRIQKAVPFILHEYAARLCWRIAFKRSSGAGYLHLRLAIYESPAAEAATRIAWGAVESFANNAWEAHNLYYDMDCDATLKRRRREGFPKLWYAALLARVDEGSSFHIGDNPGGLTTWPGFAVCTP